MIQASNVSFSYEKDNPLIRDVSFKLEKGSILGLLGHNGSGKSTLLKLLSGLLTPESGQVQVAEKTLGQWKRKDLYVKMGCMIDTPSFYDYLNLLDNMKILVNYRNIKYEQIREVIEKVGLGKYKSKKLKAFSTGMRQRAGIASLLLFSPEILLLDEPTNGLDPEGIINTRQLLKNLKGEGKTLIVSSHHLSEIEKYCDQLLILKNGRKLYFGSLDALGTYRDLEDLYLSLSHDNRNA